MSIMRPYRLIGGLLALNALLIAIGALAISDGAASGTPEPALARPPRSGPRISVGLVFDTGGKNDKSFNEAAWRGLQRARDELGVSVEFIEPSEGADRGTALRTLAARHLDLVIGVGFIFGRDLERLAVEFPGVRFAGIDYSPTEGVTIPSNLVGLRFREQEGSFLVGAIAAMLTKSNVVGFVGGMRIPLIRKFEAGYIAGVHYVCPACRVLAAYAGSEPKAFSDPTLGQELATAQYDDGADVIFHAAGKTGDGVFAAARERDAKAIGVDSDQFEMAPCCVVTSMVKRVDVAVVEEVRDVIAGKFHGGLRELGLAEDGVAFVTDDRNRALLPADVVQRVNQIRSDIIAGKIAVPDR